MDMREHTSARRYRTNVRYNTLHAVRAQSSMSVRVRDLRVVVVDQPVDRKDRHRFCAIRKEQTDDTVTKAFLKPRIPLSGLLIWCARLTKRGG